MKIIPKNELESIKTLSEDIQKEFVSFLVENHSFIARSNRQASKRARVATNNLSKLLKEYRKVTMNVTAN